MEKEYSELKTPVVEVWENILLVSIVGILDTRRAQKLMEAILYKVERESARIVIIDLTGVTSVDTAVAKHIIDTIKTIQFMGPDVCVSGISSEIAQSLVKLQITLQVKTYSTLKMAMENALKTLGLNVVGNR